MFAGKKITASTNTKIQVKPSKGQNTKVTQQIIGKTRKPVGSTNPEIKSSRQKSPPQEIQTKPQPVEIETKINTKKASLSIEKTHSRNPTQKTSEKTTEKRKEKEKSQTIKEESKACRKQKVEQKLKIDKGKTEGLKENMNQNGQEPKEIEVDQQSELSGEHDFIQYNHQDYSQEQEQQRMLPIPISHPSNPQTPEKHAPPPLQSLSEETAVLSQLGLSMEVFELEVDEIMAKQYFVV